MTIENDNGFKIAFPTHWIVECTDAGPVHIGIQFQSDTGKILYRWDREPTGDSPIVYRKIQLGESE